MGTPIILNSLDYKPSIIIFLKKKNFLFNHVEFCVSLEC